jgi:hypothetical protein
MQNVEEEKRFSETRSFGRREEETRERESQKRWGSSIREAPSPEFGNYKPLAF